MKALLDVKATIPYGTDAQTQLPLLSLSPDAVTITESGKIIFENGEFC